MQYKIVEETRKLVKKENELVAQVICNLQRIYRDRIHLKMGYSGMFKFCVEELGMSEATAQRRCDAFRLADAVPDLPERIRTGKISVSRAGEVSRFQRVERMNGRKMRATELERLVDQAQVAANDYEARKTLMSQASAPVRVPDQRRVVRGGKTVLHFEADDELLALMREARNLGGDPRMCELFKAALKEI